MRLLLSCSIRICPLLCLGLSLTAQAAPRHARIVWTQAPESDATLSWTSDRSEGAHTVYFDTEARNGDPSAYAQQQVATLSGYYDDSDGRAAYQHAYLSGLESSTRYYFVLQSEGQTSPEMYFETAHVDDRPFTLLYGGDSRSNPNQRQRMNRRISQLVGERPQVLALAHGGDYTAAGDSWSQWRQWLEDHTLTTGPDGRVLPILPARGNHEGSGRMYNQVFGEPAGAALNYWSTSFGPQFRLVTLDSEASLGGDQRNFLQQQLEQGQAQRWLVANYHRPAYPAVKSPGAAREFWVPLFSEYKADLVCESDGHALKRTVPIRNDAEHPEGVIYVGEGGLGVDQRSVAQANAWYFRGGHTQSVHHVQLIEVTANELRYSAVAEDGRVLDEVAISPKRVGTEILANFRSAAWDESGTLTVEFDKAMDTASLSELGHWLVEGLQLSDVFVDDSGWRAELRFLDELPGRYMLQGPGLLDLAGQGMVDGAVLSFEIPDVDGEDTESEGDAGSSTDGDGGSEESSSDGDDDVEDSGDVGDGDSGDNDDTVDAGDGEDSGDDGQSGDDEVDADSDDGAGDGADEAASDSNASADEHEDKSSDDENKSGDDGGDDDGSKAENDGGIQDESGQAAVEGSSSGCRSVGGAPKWLLGLLLFGAMKRRRLTH